MTWLSRLWRRGQLDTQLEAELRDHLQRQAADYVAAGMTEAEAQRRARLEFGGLEGVKESCRDARGTRWLESFGQDVRYGLRMLRRSPGFAAAAILSLALGIGANTAIFSVVNGMLLRTLPVQEPDRLVLFNGAWSHPIWEQVQQRQSELFLGAAAFASDQFDLSSGGQAAPVLGLWASGEFFELLGVPAMLGRVFTPADNARGGGPDGPVAVISHAFWQRRFAGADDVVGRPLALNGVTFTVIGVTGPSFFGPVIGRSFDVAVPLGTATLLHAESPSRLDMRAWWWLRMIARLKPGQALEDATAAVRAVQPQIREATLPGEWRAQDLPQYLADGFTLVPAASGPAEVRNRFGQPLLVLMGVVALVLLIACANLAVLLLARARERQHEFAMRRALGASGSRVARQLLTESLLIATTGACLGLVLARWSSAILVQQLSTPGDPVTVNLPLDWRVLGFTAAIAIVTALLFGAAPAWRSGRVEPNGALKQQGRTTAGRERTRIGHPLVIVQVALSLVLVFTAGLFVRTFSTLATLDLGFDREPVVVVSLDAQRTRLEGPALRDLYERVGDAASRVPGVEQAAVSALTPISGMGWNTLVEFPGAPPSPERERLVDVNAVMPGWFATYRTPLRAGRDFTAADRQGSPPVAIVNESFARRHFGGANPVGRLLRQMPPPGQPAPELEIVGVVADAAYRSVRDPFAPTLFLPLAQLSPGETFPHASLSVRAALKNPARLARSVTDAVSQVNPHLSLTARPLVEQVNASFVRERIVAMLAGFFGGLALLIAGIGLYGVTSYAVNRRRTEIGVRMALGAGAARVVRLVLGQVAAVVTLGLLAGIPLSIWVAGYASTLLYGLEPSDVPTLAGAAAVLAAIAAVAAWLPARRAARLDPAQVLREG
jgi:putative ABC transport system permease protein